jgi:bleomycin hydrolase
MLNLFFYKKEMPEAEKLEWLEKPLHDGGNWVTFRRLSRKYGVVPKKAYRESWPSSHSSEMNTILCQLLQNDLLRCHKFTNEDDFVSFRDDRLQQVLHILCSCMGTPPMNEYLISLKTSKDMPLQLKATPRSLIEMLDNPIHIDQHIQIIHDPRAKNITWHKTQHQDLQATLTSCLAEIELKFQYGALAKTVTVTVTP